MTETNSSIFGKILDTLIPSRREKRVLSAAYDRLASFSSAIPLEYCGWDQLGAQAVSPGFANLFGSERVKSFQELQGCLSPGDAAALEGLYDRLEQYGEHFETYVHTLTGGKTIKIFGKRGVVESARQVFSVLWALEVSDMAETVVRSSEAIARAEKRENELRGGLNALPFPVWMRNHNLDLTWCNKAYARAVDDTAAAVVADQKELPMSGASRADVTQRVLAQRASAQQGMQSMRGHIVIEGQRRLIEMLEIPVPQEKRMIGAAIDVTKEEEWTVAYERLAASHREGMEQLRTAIAMFDADTRLEFYNSAYEQLTGMSGTWLDSKPKIVEVIDKMRELRRLPDQADYKQYKQQWLNRFTSLIEPYEEMQYLPDGSVVRLIVVPRPQGGVLITQEDVTGRLQLETSYNTLVAVQQETIDNLSEGIAVFGEDGRLRLSNQSFTRMWGIEEALPESVHVSVVLEKMTKFFSEQEWPRAKSIILGNALDRDVRRGRLDRGDGRALEYSVTPLPDGNVLNAWFDVTDKVKVEQALMEKNAALEEAERLKMDFLANVSYQLRTPLNAIMGFAEMLHHQYFGKLNERQTEYTSSMIEAGQRLVSLINDILDLSTIEAGYLKLYPAEIAVRGLVKQVTQLTQEWARKQKLDMVVRCDEDIILFGDERRIKQVLLNLISNAINYSPGGGTITVMAVREGNMAVISVSDTGMGIPEAEIARVFTPFEKIHDQKTRRRSGAGLGLALVRSIVELHGGNVSIASREGKGTTVTFRLPTQVQMTPLADTGS